MPRPQDEDLFADSTMTFGEHLEELRKCLWRAMLGLGLGFIIGLSLGTRVVNFIQQPVTDALGRYYQSESKNRVDAKIASENKDDPERAEKIKEQTDSLFTEDQMLADEYFFSPAELSKQLKSEYPDEFRDFPELKKLDNPKNPGGMARLTLWHRMENDSRVRTKSFSTPETFSIYIKASLLFGAIVSSPWILYQMWLFVGAGLYPHEKRYVRFYLPVSVGLFLLGAAVAFYFAFGRVLDFLLQFNHWTGIDPDPRISEWLSFAMILPVGFGAGFQLPLVMFFLERVGIFTVENYLKQWKICVLAIVIIAAILTPPDPYSMTFLAAPLVLLFFGGILLCKLVPKRKSNFDMLDGPTN
jgi:sec-independent protein translocase protein TatC